MGIGILVFIAIIMLFGAAIFRILALFCMALGLIGMAAGVTLWVTGDETGNGTVTFMVSFFLLLFSMKLLGIGEE